MAKKAQEPVSAEEAKAVRELIEHELGEVPDVETLPIQRDEWNYDYRAMNGEPSMIGSRSRINILRKLNKVREKMSYLQKTGKNQAQGYKYATEKQIKEALSPLLIEHGVFLQFAFGRTEHLKLDEAKDSGYRRPTFSTELSAMYIFHDVETGEYIGGSFLGSGSGRDEKGAYAAMTGCIKYCITSNFLTATGDDPAPAPIDPDDDYIDEADNSKGKSLPAAPKTSSVAGAKEAAVPAASAPQKLFSMSPESVTKVKELEAVCYKGATPAVMNARRKYLGGQTELIKVTDKALVSAYVLHMKQTKAEMEAKAVAKAAA